MIYWNALTGGMADFLRLALDYTESMLDDFRENARKLFDCRGIWINSVNTPESGLCKCLANHIVNWTGGAAWFGQHFWDYYRFTGDETYLREHVMPYLYEVALFYEDFAVENADGYYDLYPSTSPENTPQNVWDENGCNIETVKNAAMEYALLREVLTHLIEGSRLTGMYTDKVPQWEKMRAKCRPYRINADGAIAEWLDPYYVDHYAHRHHSHLYPVFPGSEVSVDDALYPAFCRAEDLRISGGHDGTIGGAEQHSSWGMANMAAEAARLRRGNTALWCISEISRACLMGNFFTTHNDWRRMGSVCCEDCRPAPYQIDGNIGIPAAVNEMLLQSQMTYLTVLPALPDDWSRGYIHGVCARDAIRCSIDWNEDGGIVRLTAGKPIEKEVRVASGYRFANGSDRTTITLGQTETTLSVANLIGQPHKLGSMGKPTPLYDIHLLDSEGKEVGVGENGEICIKTGDEHICGLFDGYYGDEEKTREVLHDGFYHTGDVAWRDEDGFLWYVSRVDDVIKSSGYRIGPFEIESVIMELPYVLECGVSAAPDPVRGQVVKASIVLTKGTEGTEDLKKEIQNYVKHKTAPYKYPRIVVFKDELPKTISGKIQRNKL